MTDIIERVAETLANQIGMRKGCPPIKGCLALMPPHMAEIFRDDARAAIDATRIEQLHKEVERLRDAMIRSGRAAGCFLSDSVTTDFLMLVPAEIEAKIEQLVERESKARAALTGEPSLPGGLS